MKKGTKYKIQNTNIKYKIQNTNIKYKNTKISIINNLFVHLNQLNKIKKKIHKFMHKIKVIWGKNERDVDVTNFTYFL